MWGHAEPSWPELLHWDAVQLCLRRPRHTSESAIGCHRICSCIGPKPQLQMLSRSGSFFSQAMLTGLATQHLHDVFFRLLADANNPRPWSNEVNLKAAWEWQSSICLGGVQILAQQIERMLTATQQAIKDEGRQQSPNLRSNSEFPPCLQPL